jgi:hypothetical protein
MSDRLTYTKGLTCHHCGRALYDGYPFTVCDGCWAATMNGDTKTYTASASVVSPDDPPTIDVCGVIAAERDRYHDLARRLARVADAANEWRMWNDVSDELHEALDALNSDDLAVLLGDDGA